MSGSVFPVTLDSWGTVTDNVDYVYAQHINELRDAAEKLEAKVGIDSSADTTSLDYKINNFFASGRKVWFYQAAAPTGWAAVGAIGDRLLALKGGTEAYNVLGGNTAGDTWDLAGLTHDHTHSGTTDTSGYPPQDQGGGSNSCSTYPHAHGYTTDSPDDDTVSSDGTWRPDAAVGIVCSKS